MPSEQKTYYRKIVLTLLIVALIWTGWTAFKNKVGDIRPAVLKNTNETVSKNSKTEIFAQGFEKPRDLEFSPGGTLLVSDMGGGRIVTVPDKKVIVSELNNPHGIAFYKNKLFIAEETRVSRYAWDEKTSSAVFEKKILDLPGGGRHSTRSIVFDKDGRLFVTIGSTCDVCFEKHPWLTTVVVTDSEGRSPRVFSKGLRNAVFITVNPKTNELWGTEMGRDFLGDELPPDEINILKDGRDYGWPVCYGDKIYDTNFGERDSSYCNNTEVPAYKIAAHSAPLGLTFHDDYLYVAYHGSWNRSTPIGYKVVRMKVDGDRVGSEEEVLKDVRAVDVIFDKEGNLYISDDRDGVIYRLSEV